MLTVTAIGGLGAGTVSIGPAGRAPTTTVPVGYSAHTVTTNTAIIPTGSYTSQSGIFYPGISVLNNGTHAVHLIISVNAFYDDDTLLAGERYTPTTAVRLLSARLGQRGTRVISPGSHAGARTTAMSSKLIISGPTRSTSEAIWPRGISGVGAPANPQARAVARQSSATGVFAMLGAADTAYLRNATGVATVNLWSFGHFDYYPIARAHGYLAGRPGASLRRGPGLTGKAVIGVARPLR